jgi:hypothetical protein
MTWEGSPFNRNDRGLYMYTLYLQYSILVQYEFKTNEERGHRQWPMASGPQYE